MFGSLGLRAFHQLNAMPRVWFMVCDTCRRQVITPHAVVRLRKVLGVHAIETEPFGYRLAVPLDEIDAQRFGRAVGRARGVPGVRGHRDPPALTGIPALGRHPIRVKRTACSMSAVNCDASRVIPPT